jgi:hypothetical protein
MPPSLKAGEKSHQKSQYSFAEYNFTAIGQTTFDSLSVHQALMNSCKKPLRVLLNR